MMERRNVLGGGLVAGLTGMLAAPALTEAAAAADDTSEAAAAAIDRLRTFAERQAVPGNLGAVSSIRQQQRTFIRAHEKYPDFIEVGLNVFEEVYDWHVRYRQPINAGRMADGRYALTFMFTSLILRPDQAPEYVGFGFDADTPRRANP